MGGGGGQGVVVEWMGRFAFACSKASRHAGSWQQAAHPPHIPLTRHHHRHHPHHHHYGIFTAHRLACPPSSPAQVSWEWASCGDLIEGNIMMLVKPGGTVYFQAVNFANSKQV